MIVSEKIEQTLHHKPPTYYVPGYTFLRLLGQPDVRVPDKDLDQLNVFAHYNFGALVGAAKGIMAPRDGLRISCL